MCCSLAARVRQNARLPLTSTVSPTSLPGIWRIYFSRVAMIPTGAAIARRNREALQLARHDIGFPRRLKQAQRHCFREHNNQQRTCGRNDGCNLFNTLEQAKEIRRLYDYTCDLMVQVLL